MCDTCHGQGGLYLGQVGHVSCGYVGQVAGIGSSRPAGQGERFLESEFGYSEYFGNYLVYFIF